MGLSDDPRYHDACMPETPAQVSANMRDTIDDLRRQLAAANERAGRLEAQMVELREGWPSFEYVDDTEGMVAVEVPEVVIQNFHRILGGA